MLQVSMIPSYITHGKYIVSISGFSNSDNEGGSIYDGFSVGVLDNDFATFTDGLYHILSKHDDGDMQYPSYHSLTIKVSFNGNDIQEEYNELLKETKKHKEALNKNDYGNWCSFVLSEIENKEFIFNKIEEIAKLIFS